MSPLTVIGDVAPLADTGVVPSLHVALKPVIALPLSAGGTKFTTICALPAVSVGAAGWPGTVAGTAGADAGDAGLGPTALVAVTVHV